MLQLTGRKLVYKTFKLCTNFCFLLRYQLSDADAGIAVVSFIVEAVIVNVSVFTNGEETVVAFVVFASQETFAAGLASVSQRTERLAYRRPCACLL